MDTTLTGIATLVAVAVRTGTVIVTSIEEAIQMFADLFGHALTDAEAQAILTSDLVDSARREALAKADAGQ